MSTLAGALAGVIMATLCHYAIPLDASLAYADAECRALAEPWPLHETPVMPDGAILCVVDCTSAECWELGGAWERNVGPGYHCELWTVLP